MSFASPIWFFLVLFPLAQWLWQRQQSKRQLNQFADPALLPWIVSEQNHSAHRLRWGLYGVIWLLLSVALAGPQTPRLQATQMTDHQRVFVVDISASMSVADMGQTRQTHAVMALAQWSSRRHPYHTAILTYAAQPHWLLPNTSDPSAFEFYVDQLTQLRPPTEGSRPSEAFEAVLAMPPRASRSVVWMTDGDIGAAEVTALQPVLAQLRERQIPVFIYALGTADGDFVVDSNGDLLAEQGVPHRSRMPLDVLKTLAEQAGIQVVHARNHRANWDQIEQAMPFADPGGDTQYTQWFWLPLLLAMGLLMWLWRVPYTALALVLFMVVFPHAQAETFADGVVAYRAGDYARAADVFANVVLDADSDMARGRALYNLGNSYFQLGDFARAAEAFADSQVYRPDHRLAADNQRLALAVLEAMRGDEAALEARAGDAVGAMFERRSDSMPDSGSRASINRSSAAQNAALTAIDQLTLQTYIDRGRAYLQNSTLGDMRWQRRDFALDDARLQLQSLGQQDASVFNRLFEIEEGISAPLKEPKTIEGVLPW